MHRVNSRGTSGTPPQRRRSGQRLVEDGHAASLGGEVGTEPGRPGEQDTRPEHALEIVPGLAVNKHLVGDKGHRTADSDD